MGILKKLVIFLIYSFSLGELVRFQVTNTIAITPSEVLSFVIVFLWLFIKKGKSRKTHTSLRTALLIFYGVCLLSFLGSLSLFPVKEVFTGSLYFFRFIVFVQIIWVVGSFEKNIREQFLTHLGISGFMVVIGGYIQFFFFSSLRPLFTFGWDEHLYRLFGTFLDPNFVAAFLVMTLLLLVKKIFDNLNNPNIRALYIGMSVLTLFAIFLTYSRSGYIMLLIATITFFLFKGKKIGVGLIIVVTVLFILLNVKNFYVENINLFRSVSTGARLETAGNALSIIQKNPFFGVGFNNYRYAQIKYGTRLPVTKYTSHADAGTDNSFLFVLATTGIIGFIAYLFFWGKIMQLAFGALKIKEKRDTALIFIAIIGGLFVNALFINSLFHSFIMLFLWIVIGALNAED